MGILEINFDDNIYNEILELWLLRILENELWEWYKKRWNFGILRVLEIWKIKFENGIKKDGILRVLEIWKINFENDFFLKKKKRNFGIWREKEILGMEILKMESGTLGTKILKMESGTLWIFWNLGREFYKWNSELCEFLKIWVWEF